MAAPKRKTKKKVLKKKLIRVKSVKRAKTDKTKSKRLVPRILNKARENPIIMPVTADSWQSKATFNPTALYHDGKVHIIYRAIGHSDESVLGYAKSSDGLSVDARSSHPVFTHTRSRERSESLPKISYTSGGGWGGGSEDPRLTLIDGKVYLIYTAFDGWGSIRIALSSISLDDFISNRWDWKKPVLISPPGEINKNWVLFSDKVNNKFAVLHSLSPEILVDYFDDLDELDGSRFIKSIHQGSPSWYRRDKGIRGVGPAPIKTKYGWLVLYHAMESDNPSHYKLWAMILDLNNPKKILYRGVEPVLEPDQPYENDGFKSGVVYSCGAVVKDGELFVYYGGADTVSCVATANFEKFLEEVISSRPSRLTKKKIKSRT